jgi:hypothetical protein
LAIFPENQPKNMSNSFQKYGAWNPLLPPQPGARMCKILPDDADF